MENKNSLVEPENQNIVPSISSEQLEAQGLVILDQPVEVEPGLTLIATGPSPDELDIVAPDNVNAADTTNANELRSGGSQGLNLNGNGITVGVWDGGKVRNTHQEFGSRVTIADSASNFSSHATHVAGTIGATGVQSAARGMANQVDILSYDWNDDYTEMNAAANQANPLILSNHSYGTITGWTTGVSWGSIGVVGSVDTWWENRSIYSTESPRFGKYSSSARDLDQVLYDNPNLLSVWSAGNDRNDTFTNARGTNEYVTYLSSGVSTPGWYLVSTSIYSAPGGDGNGGTGYDSLPGNKVAKNSLVVGAINDITADPYNNSDVTMSSFSDWGPTDDGRMKPDVVGNGVFVNSPIASSNSSYGNFSGTSMAAPNVTGTTALLYEHYDDLFSATPRSATMKGLLTHTAFDAGNVGPDYTYGWGVVDGAAAANFLTDVNSTNGSSQLIEGSYTGSTQTINITANPGDQLKATLVWTDLPGTPHGNGLDETTPVLVNDLDLSITGPNGTTYYPWTLNPANPSAPAVKNKANNLDNVEQVLIDATATQSGTYTINIEGGSFSQDYSLLISGVGNQQPTGEISGTKWNDLDGDGVRDPGEAGLQGWTIYLDQNQNGQLDSGETSTTTDANGNYSFTDLAADTYYVAEVLQSGWEQTYPGNSNSSFIPGPNQTIITTTNSQVPIVTYGEVVAPSDDNSVRPQTNVSGSLINIDDFRADPRFAGIDGSGFATVILDTGIDLNHPFFGADNNNDGVADRIVYHYDFADGDPDASDVNGHGSNVSSIVASSDNTYTGMAPGADIIHLKVFEDNGGGNFGYTEQALQWVIANAATYNIASVNMSLGDSGNYATAQTLYGIDDELAALAGMDIVVASASGNSFYSFNSQQGVAYPSADPNSLSIGAVYDSNTGGWSYGSGASASSSGADYITPFSQRDDDLTTVFAPGAPITGAGSNGGTVTQHGTSQASPHIAGIAVLAQQLAQQTLGRRLTVTEFNNLLVSTGVTINDGDDENDNVTNTGLDFKRVDVQALGEAILNMATSSDIHVVNLSPGQIVTDKNFGNRQIDNFIGETGTISNLTDSPQTITLDRSYQNPVVFAQPLSFNGSQPAAVRLDNVTSNSFTVSVQEPNNEDGTHAAENLSYIVMEAGSWELADGTKLQVGTTDSNQLVSEGWENVNLNAGFDSTPVVMSQVQTFNGTDFVRTRQRNIGANGFQVGMEEEEANKNSGHTNETIGYFAMSGGSGNWNGLNYIAGNTGDTVTDAWETVNFGDDFSETPQILASLASYDGPDPAGLRYQNLNNNQVEIKIEEDTSADAETAHTTENVSFLAIEGSGSLTASPVNPGSPMGETGTINNLTHTPQTITLNRSYQNPVVFAQPLSFNGSAPAAVRLDNITNNSFTVSVQEPNNEDGTHAAENLSYIVMEAGNWELADGTKLQVGTTDSNQLVSQGWETVNLNAGFGSTPVVMSQIQTFNGADFARTRQRNIGANGFQVGMEEEEANKNSGHTNETIGYFAMSGGSGNWSGLNYTAGNTGDNVTDAWKTVNFGAGFSQTPQILASLASYDGSDSAGIRRRNLNNNQVQFKVEEDTSADAEMTHTTENVSFLAIEGSGILEAVNADSLTGTSNSSPVLPGMQTLQATESADTFMLGDASQAYYDKMGIQDYALIMGFDSSSDTIQLHGSASEYQLGAVPDELPQGTGIFLKNSPSNELVGVVSGVSDLALDADYFSFV